MDIVALPWFRDGVSNEDMRAIRRLGALSRLDVQLVSEVVDVPPLPGEWTPRLSEVFGAFHAIARIDLEFARMLAGYSWIQDGVSGDENQTLFSLEYVAEVDSEAARQLADYRWMADGLTDGERHTLAVLLSYAGDDPAYMRAAIDSTWIEDGISDDEFVRMALALPEDMKEDLTDDLSEVLEEYLLHSLATLGKVSSRHLLSLGSQDWVADGLTNEEAAFIVSISHVPHENPRLFESILQEKFAQTGTVSLPYSGEVKAWVFSNDPHLDEENVLGEIEYIARVAEDFIRVPLRTTDIIVLVIDFRESDRRTNPFKTDSHIQLTDYGSLYHEMAHYYFSGSMRWMNEGGAEFIEDLEAYPGEIGASSPGGRAAAESAHYCMERYGFENIRHLNHVRLNNYREWNVHRPDRCHYSMGRNFLHVAYDTIGSEALSSALGEIVSSADAKASDEDKERAIYDSFTKYTPVSLQEDFKRIYRKLHGGPHAYDEPQEADDHGNGVDDATPLKVGESVQGSLDYMFDFDYFRFVAKEGRKYRFSVAHESLGASSVGLFSGPDGIWGENQNWEFRELGSSGPEIVWVAPESDEYWLAVQNFGGKTGTYTLAISEAQDD